MRRNSGRSSRRHLSKLFYLALPLLPSSYAVDAAPLFPSPVFPVGAFPQTVAIGDFNEDGRPDLVTANFGSGDVSVLLGLGDGAFEPQVRVHAGLSPRSIAVGDFNRDGHLDLAVTVASAATGGAVNVLLGAGDGSFVALSSIDLFAPVFVAVGDFDEDGIEDLAAAETIAGTVTILKGMGDGTFVQRGAIPTGGDPRFVVVADFNRDGHQDAAVADYGLAGNGHVIVALGIGDGTFGAPSVLEPRGRPRSIALGDFDLDGFQDLAVADSVGSVVSVLMGLGDGSFKEPVPVETLVFQTESVAAGDFDGDGRQDLAALSNTRLSTLTGRGDGTFGPPVLVPVGGPFVTAGDLDGDRRTDLIVLRSNDVAILTSTRDGTFGSSALFPTGFGNSGIATGDLDGDGRPDLVVPGGGFFFIGEPGRLSVLLGREGGDFVPLEHLAEGLVSTSVAVGEFNGDGYPDLVVANGASPDLGIPEGHSVLLGSGDGRFDAPTYFEAGTAPSSVAVGDFNGDGVEDVVAANAGPSQFDAPDSNDDVSILLGTGDGSFELQTRFEVGDGPTSVVVGDFNADGRQDLAVANGYSEDVSVLLGGGDGGFGDQMRFAVGRSPSRLTAGDLNGDGLQDLVVANGGSADISVLFGRGDGTFEEERRLSAGVEPTWVVVADLDADGREDVAVANRRSLDISVLRGRGDGTFDPQMRFNGGGFALAVADVDGDRRNDLVDVGFASVRVLFNQGPFPNTPPRAAPGPDIVAECASPAGAGVTLDGSASTDPDSTPGTNEDIVSFEWRENPGRPDEVLLGIGAVLHLTLPLGAHVIALRVTDSRGATDSARMIATVRDTTPPTVHASLTPTHSFKDDNGEQKMGAFVVGASATDTCCSVTTLAVMEIPQGAGSFQVRFERGAEGESKIIFDFDRRRVDLRGRDESATRALLGQIIAEGGARVVQGQRLQLELPQIGGAPHADPGLKKMHRYTFVFHGRSLVKEGAPTLILKVTARDASGNVATVSIMPRIGKNRDEWAVRKRSDAGRSDRRLKEP